MPGLPHHIVQRGHNRQPVLVDDRYYEYFLSNLKEWKATHGLAVYSYCLMMNHVQLIVAADDDLAGIPQLMKRLAGRQTRFLNAMERRSSSLWEGRYKASPIDTDAYLLSCCRYVELNPEKARMIESPEVHPWPSYSVRVGLAGKDWLDVPPAWDS